VTKNNTNRKLEKDTAVNASVSLHRNPKSYVVTLVFSLSLVAFILACQLSVAGISYDDNQSNSLTETMLGDSRIAISYKLYTQADVYFHRGVPHQKRRAFDSDPFQKIHHLVCPTKHDHLSGAGGIKEMMPWLDMAIRANPQNLESYLVAAFWLSREANLDEKALQILEKAQRNIPYSYEVQLDKGRLLLHMGNYDLARLSFSAALAFWNKSADPTSKSALLDRSQALLFRAMLYEECGKTSEAIEDLQAVLSISPNNPQLKKRLINLQKGIATEPSAHDLLASILNKQDKQSSKCAHEDHAHEEHKHSEKCKHVLESDQSINLPDHI